MAPIVHSLDFKWKEFQMDRLSQSLPVLDTPSHDTVFWLKLCVCVCERAVVYRLLLRVRSRVRRAERLFPALLPEEGHSASFFLPLRGFFFLFSPIVYTELLRTEQVFSSAPSQLPFHTDHGGLCVNISQL